MRRIIAPELMDDPAVDAGDLAGNFDDIERANRWFGGIAPVARAVFAHADAVRLLDVGCGSADVARALLRRAAMQGRAFDVVALDASKTVLDIARARTDARSGLHFVHADALALPFDDGAFDVVTCNLALHHFEPDDAVLVLRELRRVARIAPLVCDLVRSRVAYVATLAFARFVARNRLTRHDAPLSVRRAYTRREALALAVRAGWRAPKAQRSPYFRMLLSDGA